MPTLERDARTAAARPPLVGGASHNEVRSAWLRLVVFVLLTTNLVVAKEQDNLSVHANLVVGYGIATLMGLAVVVVGRAPTWLPTAAVAVDAILTIALFHEHLFAGKGPTDHQLSAVSVAVGFMLLAHVALRLRPQLLLMFSGAVLTGWLGLLLAGDRSILQEEIPLAASFAFGSFVCWLLVRDHNTQLERAVASDRRHRNLARFFPPEVVADLQTSRFPLGLDRRRAAVMFLDLRAFTRYSETAKPEDVAELVASYRDLVTKIVFEHSGVIDKFLGDGIMVVFGHPQTQSDDARRAFSCATALQAALALWANRRRLDGKSALDAGIGLHVGEVVAGVLQSASHDEFTLFGDVVNVAQRLEGLCKDLNASLVMSVDAATSAGLPTRSREYLVDYTAVLNGRERPVDVLYLPRNRSHDLYEGLPSPGTGAPCGNSL